MSWVLQPCHLIDGYGLGSSVFLFSVGFAFASPAQASVIAEMVSAEELGSAFTLGGLQMDVSGIIGPLLGGFLVPLVGASFVFGANGLGFLFMFLAIRRWKRKEAQSNLPLETFFESLATAIRYVRYTHGIKILLLRNGLFSFFIAIIPSLMPVIGLKELHLTASYLGYLFTSMAAGSVISGAFIIPWVRAKYSPQTITTCANLLLIVVCILMATVHRPNLLLAVAALGGMGWTLSASELWVASQRAMPDWARGRMNATIVMFGRGATAVGAAIWGLADSSVGVVPTFLGAAAFELVLMIVVRAVPAFRMSIDFTTKLKFESAPVTIFSYDTDPARLPAPQDGPVSITTQLRVDPTRRSECIAVMREARLIFLRNGAYRWHLYEDLNKPNEFRMEVVVPSWKQHLLQSERMTKSEKEVIEKLRNLRIEPHPPEDWVSLSVDREVLKKSVRSDHLTSDHLNL
jgi:MFS family permease